MSRSLSRTGDQQLDVDNSILYILFSSRLRGLLVHRAIGTALVLGKD